MKQELGDVTEVCSSEDKNFNYIQGYQIPDDLDYLHITTNNTIFEHNTRICPIVILY